MRPDTLCAVVGREADNSADGDGFARQHAQRAVGDILFKEDVTDILALYRKGRAILEDKVPEVDGHTTDRGHPLAAKPPKSATKA